MLKQKATVIVIEQMLAELERKICPQDHVRMKVIFGKDAKCLEQYERLGGERLELDQ